MNDEFDFLIEPPCYQFRELATKPLWPTIDYHNILHESRLSWAILKATIIVVVSVRFLAVFRNEVQILNLSRVYNNEY